MPESGWGERLTVRAVIVTSLANTGDLTTDMYFEQKILSHDRIFVVFEPFGYLHLFCALTSRI